MAVLKNLALLGIAASSSMALPAPYAGGPDAGPNVMARQDADAKWITELASAAGFPVTLVPLPRKRDTQSEDRPLTEAELQWLVNGPPVYTPESEKREAVPPPDLDEDVFTILPYPLPKSVTQDGKRRAADPQQDNVFTILPYPLPQDVGENMKRQDSGEDVFTILPYPLLKGDAENSKRQDLGEDVFTILPYPLPDGMAYKSKRQEPGEDVFTILPYPLPNGVAESNKRQEENVFTILPYPLPESAEANREE
ncbi:eukaryotic aspartyl protease [Emericellopsis cladophorae]|uniref:Eukaryotic aspartyl protease n=1 Tax=Emericellopsis cladophorae TaxID=2686198 RepID=A0A9P9Y8F7_9HYPO|nr:eukaryotic aspartyl protease [Emericellopsis cladophorae]KAI6785003.1 eukaryotic aspartyl protease [Emericellopsis cladophorae]